MSGYLESKIIGHVSRHTREILDEIQQKKKLPMIRLIAMAIEHELERENPFEYDVTVPSDKYVEHAYASDAGKILTYLKRSSGMSLENLCIMRHDIGIPDKKTLLLAFRECLLSRQIESYKPKKQLNSKFDYNEDDVFYRIKGAGTFKKKVERKKATRYDMFQKLKKEFKNEN